MSTLCPTHAAPAQPCGEAVCCDVAQLGDTLHANRAEVRLVPNFRAPSGRLAPARATAGNTATLEQLRAAARGMHSRSVIARIRNQHLRQGRRAARGTFSIQARADRYELRLRDVRWSERSGGIGHAQLARP